MCKCSCNTGLLYVPKPHVQFLYRHVLSLPTKSLIALHIDQTAQNLLMQPKVPETSSGLTLTSSRLSRNQKNVSCGQGFKFQLGLVFYLLCKGPSCSIGPDKPTTPRSLSRKREALASIFWNVNFGSGESSYFFVITVHVHSSRGLELQTINQVSCRECFLFFIWSSMPSYHHKALIWTPCGRSAPKEPTTKHQNIKKSPPAEIGILHTKFVLTTSDK